MLVIDDSGDRKDGAKTAHVGHQYLGRYGKTDNGVVTVTTARADERLYYPVHAVPYTPARHFAKGKNDPGFRTKLRIGAPGTVRSGRLMLGAGMAHRLRPVAAPANWSTGPAQGTEPPSGSWSDRTGRRCRRRRHRCLAEGTMLKSIASYFGHGQLADAGPSRVTRPAAPAHPGVPHSSSPACRSPSPATRAHSRGDEGVGASTPRLWTRSRASSARTLTAVTAGEDMAAVYRAFRP